MKTEKLRVKLEYFRNIQIKCSLEVKQKGVDVIEKMQRRILLENTVCQLIRLCSSNVILSTPFFKIHFVGGSFLLLQTSCIHN